MLPGFRFLFVAIVLSTSMLIFGLGAAALLRAAHEEFASIPSRRAPPETQFAQRDDAGATLALVRIEPSAADEKAVIADSAPDQAAIVSVSPGPEESAKESDKIATLIDAAMPTKDSLLSSTSEIPVEVETSAQADSPLPVAETKLAPIAEVTPTASPDRVTATAPNQEAAPVDDSARIAETKIATLGGPPVTIETQTPSKIAPAVVKKPAQAKRVVKRRRIAPRARVTQQAPQTPADPFARPFGR
jgi:cytoskeletal protein RodZ